MLAAVIVFMFMGLALMSSAAAIGLGEARTAPLFEYGAQGYYAAEGGFEDAVHRIKSGMQISSEEMLAVGSGVATTTITDLGSDAKRVESAGDRRNAIRNIRGDLSTSVGAAFHFGVQVGQGGILAENTSQVIGSVQSAGNVRGNNSAQITGDVFVTGSGTIDNITIGGSAYAYEIANAEIGGTASSTTRIRGTSVGEDAFADRITTSSVGDDAYYFTELSGTTVGGSTFPGSVPPSEYPAVAFPISDEDIAAREAWAVSGGVVSSPCPYTVSSGSVTLGPVKIVCDVQLSGSGEIIVAGPIWIAGNLTMQNSARLVLAASYGDESEMVIADNPASPAASGIVTVQNSSSVLGSGDPSSYLLLVSMNNDAESGGARSAINPKNSSDAAVYYAPHGKILIENTSALKEATAYFLHLKNGATITYESGLANIEFASGPTGGWKIDSWSEVE